MNRAQFWILNVVGGACAALVIGGVVLGRLNERTILELDTAQARVNRAQQVQATGKNLIIRIAQAAKSEPALKDLLTRHELKVELDNESPSRPVP